MAAAHVESFISPTVKYSLFLTNALFWIAGIGLVLIGSWAFATKELEGSKRVTSAWSYVFDVALIFIVIGAVAFFIASAGCTGTLRENVCLLKTFWISLSLIDFALLCIGLVGLLMWNEFVSAAKQKLSIQMIKNYNDDSDLADLMNFVQEEFECCGLSDKGYEDWSENAYYNCSDHNVDPRRCGVPHSCCRHWKDLEKSKQNYYCGYNLGKESDITSRIYANGCIEAVVSSIRRNVLLFSLSAFAIALIPMISIYLAKLLISQIELQKARWMIDSGVHDHHHRLRYIVTRA